MKNKTFFQSVRCAFKGLSCAFKTEKNFKYYLGIAVLFLMVNLLLGVGLPFYILYAIPVCGVFSAELFNTALEELCNLISTEANAQIRRVKDISAGAVLFWGFSFFAAEAVIILMALLNVFS